MSEHPAARVFDVAVVGAGPSGAAAARRIASHGCRVALIDRSPFDAPRVGESLVPSVQPLLCELGVWTEFLALDPIPSHGTRSVWGQATPEMHSHLMSPWGCGWHVDRLAFDRMLVDAARRAGAVFFSATTTLDCERDAEGWSLTLSGRDSDDAESAFEVHARIVIDATGRSARLARRVGATRLVFDHLVGVATCVRGIDTTCEGYVMVETTADGWWYTSPLPGGGMMVMLMTDADLCGRADLSSSQTWWTHLHAASATRARVADHSPSWGPSVFSAVSQRLRRRDARSPWLAVGDASLAVDPITGSGVVRALRSARAGADAALSALDGSTDAIVEYEADRDDECTTYLHERVQYYGIEKRFESYPFWQRRR
jgi:flavin-dependent dehydrogenase